MAEYPGQTPRQLQPYHAFQRGFSMGPAPGAIPADAALWAINVDTARGDLRGRRGRQRVGNRLPLSSSTCYFIGQYRRHVGGGTVILQTLRVNATDLYEFNPVTDLWEFRGSVSSQRLTTGVQLLNRMWFGDGTAMTVWDGTTVQRWGTDAPLGMTHVSEAAVGGNLFDTDAYEVVYTLLSSTTGEQSNPSPALTRTMSAGTNTILWTVQIPAQSIESRFDKARVYRTAANEALHERESTHDYTGAAIQVTVGTRTDSDLGSVVDYENDPPPFLWWFVKYQNRFFGSSHDAASVLRWSPAGAPWAFPALNNLPINEDDGDELTGGLVMHGTLYVFKRREAHAVTAHPLFGFVYTELPADFGALSHHSLVVVGNYAYGLDERGIWVFNGGQFSRLTDLAMDWFLKSRRDPKALEAVAVTDARPDRPYYRVVLRGPDPRDPDGPTQTWWVNMHEETHGLDLYEGWSANVVATVHGTNRIPEVWSGDDQGAVYRHFEDASGVDLYTDENADGVPQGISVDYRTSDLALGEVFGTASTPDGQRPGAVSRYMSKAVTGIFCELERSDGPPPTITFTSYLDGVASSNYERAGFDTGDITKIFYWRHQSQVHRRVGLRLRASGTFDMRVAGFAWEFTPSAFRARGEPPAAW